MGLKLNEEQQHFLKYFKQDTKHKKSKCFKNNSLNMPWKKYKKKYKKEWKEYFLSLFRAEYRLKELESRIEGKEDMITMLRQQIEDM